MGVHGSLTAGVTAPLAAGGEHLRQRMLLLTRSLFGVAAIALLAIAVTIAVMFYFHERSSSWVINSREVSRLARTAYARAVDRELERRALSDPGRPDANDRFRITLDSLRLLAGASSARIASLATIADAYDKWAALLDSGATPSQQQRALEHKRLDVLRARLGLFIASEDLRYAQRLADEKNVRFLSSAAVLTELIILLLVINGIRRRLITQATEVLRQKDELEKQADRLERSNAELAAAMQEKELARAEALERAEEQDALLSGITEVFFVLDREGWLHKAAPADHELLTSFPGELVGKNVSDIVHAELASEVMAAIRKAIETGQRVDVEYSLWLGDRTVWFNATVKALGDNRVLWVARDVSESRLAAEAVRESEARFRNLVEHSPQAVALQSEGRVAYVNPACEWLLGALEGRLVGMPLLQLVTKETSPRFVDSLLSMGVSPARSVTCECEFRRMSDGRTVTVEVTSVPVRYDGKAGVLSILHDVTERRQLEDQLAHQAFHDPLTNLANRVLFRDRVEHALQRAERGRHVPSVLFIDLDNFKAVNDSLGHSAGDWLLIEVSARLTNCLRPADTVARLGGDEFGVLIDDEAAEPRKVANRLLEAFRVPFTVQGTDIVVTLSIGIASLQPHQDADEVLRNADLALYRAKGQGKACAATFEPEMHVAALRRLEMETELRRAIEGDPAGGRLVVHYQPIARLSTGKLFGIEALVRWEHPERGVLEPLDFISLAEETGLIVGLGRWVLNESCRQAMEWQVRYRSLLKSTGMYLLVSVNLSGRHLTQPEIVKDVSRALRSSSLAPDNLMLEMTESMLVHDNRATLERLHSLKSLGVRLAIDDFGTGYSSLAYLERFPVDSLKMDRSFITSLVENDSKAPLAEAVIGLGRILGLRVVAEGIETGRQWDRLRQLGCGLGQGYHISVPLPAPDFEQYLRTTAEASKGRVNARFSLHGSGANQAPLSGLVVTS